MICFPRTIVTTVLLILPAYFARAEAPPDRAPSTSTTAPADVQAAEGVRLVPLGLGTAKNTINVVVFRKQSLVAHDDVQFAAYYDAGGHVVLGKRKLGEDKWELKTTSLTGDLRDAHKAISIGVDGDGYLHIAWNHHGNRLHYQRGVEPMSLEMAEAKMTGQNEGRVTYPEFHLLGGGDLLFLYRDGVSGQGNLAMNRYDVKTRTWRHLTGNLVDGEGERNAYWQACTDAKGTIHLSWVWRETGDVATNHDVCYACSTDGGQTWTRSTGEKYALPITAASAEYALKVPQKHELINQTSMTADAQGHPYIATYFRPEGTDVPQYFLIYNDGASWHTSQVGQLTTPFRLGGGGTKRVPISRPQILSREQGGRLVAHLVFRADERGDRATLATCDDLAKGQWRVRDLTTSSLDQWEPTYDPILWQRDGLLHLFIQRAEQVDGERVGTLPPQRVYVAEVKP